MKLNIPKPLKITLIIILIIAILLLYLWARPFILSLVVVPLWFLATLMVELLTPPPPPPQIEYAEFPIELVYEIDGTEYEIKDTIICEYDDWEIVGDSTKQRVWKMHLESGKDDFVIYNDGKVAVSWDPLSASTYMGDQEDRDYEEYSRLTFYVTSDTYSHKPVSTKYLFNKFGITNIQFYPPEPIENSFSYLNYFR